MPCVRQLVGSLNFDATRLLFKCLLVSLFVHVVCVHVRVCLYVRVLCVCVCMCAFVCMHVFVCM